MALGFEKDEYLNAHADHAERVARIQQAQSKTGAGATGPDGKPITVPVEGTDLAARGVTDMSANQHAGAEEKAASRDTTLNATTVDTTRGKARTMGPVGGAGNPGLGGISGGGSRGGKF